ncbi:MAG: GNAT family N-acetyltransferase [Polyangiaceae bacterium]|nr:GNAT family N-acetyltransferase [Polyangiaceae bacterium]
MTAQIRPIRRQDRAQFQALTALRPGYDEKRAERRTDVIWHIAFENPVQDGKPTYYVAATPDKIVCHMGRMPTRFWIRGGVHDASFAHDLFADPELQSTGRGFFITMKLYKKVEDTCDSFCGLLWTNELNVKLQQSRKYDQLWTQPYVRVLNTERLLAQLPLPPAVSTFARKMGDASLRAFDAALERVVRGDTELVTRFDERFDRFAQQIGPLQGVAPVKDAAYLRWRYQDWPYLRTSTFAISSRSEQLRGFIVLREPDPDESSGRILDIVCDPRDKGAAQALAMVAIEHYRAMGKRRIECVATEPWLQRALRGLFFVPRGGELPVFFLNGHKYPEVEHLRSIENWHVAFGDSEGGEVP